MVSRLQLNEVSAAFADLGTFLPLVVGLILIAGMHPVGILFGFGVFAVATGLFYRRPIPVQPMKAVAAAGIAGIAGPEILVASGLLLGATLLVLSQTDWISTLKRLIPKTVLHGMRLALAVSLIATVFGLSDVQILPLIVLGALLILVQLSFLKSISCLVIILIGLLWLGEPIKMQHFDISFSFPETALPSLDSIILGLETLFLPQLALTLTNALILTAVIAQDYFPERAETLSERQFAMTSGLANLLLSPFGAVPMCHGAGGVSAYYGMGSRNGVSIIIFGSVCLIIALFFGDHASHLMRAIPPEVTVTLVLFAAWVLADPLKFLQVRPSCQMIIVLMIPLTLFGGLFLALIGGTLLEHIRAKYYGAWVSGH
jgi:hypothetical protein